MKRSLILLVTLTLLLAACATTSAPSSNGTITAVNGNTITIANANGDGSSTYALTNRTYLYAPDGSRLRVSYLAAGQHVMVWADGENAVRINLA